jgi:predicted  nucleic acid-binding Zn-ribbon protein
MAVCVVVAGPLAVFSGCASGADAKGTVTNMGSFGNEVAKVKDSLDSTVKALEAVASTPAGEVKATSAAFTTSVKALDEQAKVVKERADEMKAKGDEFFSEWGASEAVSAERRTQLATSFAKIKEDMALARDEFTPLLNALKDIDGYLTLDPTLKGAESMASLVKGAKDNAARVKSRIDAVLGQVNSVRGMLSTAPK